MAYIESVLVQPIILGGRRSPRRRGHRTGYGFDLGDYTGGHRGPNDVVAAVVLATDAVEGLDVNGVGCPASTIFAGWRQSVLPVHLLGLDALLGCVGAVAGDVKLQDDGVMDHPVNRRRGGHGVGKDAFPRREDQV